MSRVATLEAAFLAWLASNAQPAWARVFTAQSGWLMDEMRSTIGTETRLFLRTLNVNEVGKVGSKKLDHHLLELGILAAMPPAADVTLDTLADQILQRVGTGLALGASGRILRATREEPRDNDAASTAAAWECHLMIEGEVFA